MNDPTRWTIRIAAALAAVLWCSACNLHFDLDSVEPSVSAEDTDAGHLDVSDTHHDSATDAPQTPDTTGEDAPTTPDATNADADATIVEGCTGDDDCPAHHVCNGEICVPTPNCTSDGASGRNCGGNLGTVEGECDPLSCEACDADQTCMLRLRFDGGHPDAFVASCLTDDEIGDGLPEQACGSAGDCGPRTLCVTWDAPDSRSRVCSRLCDLATGKGCPDGYFCTNPLEDTLGELGFCTRSCNPQDNSDCAGSEVCAYDPNYPNQTCLREFRCLQNGGFSGKGQGDPCDAAALHTDGCPTGFLCVPDHSGDTCQKTCTSTNECDGQSSCQGAPGGLNTCQ